MKSRRKIHNFFTALLGVILGFNLGVEAMRALMPKADTKDMHIWILHFISVSLVALATPVYVLLRPPPEKAAENVEAQNEDA